MHQSEVASFPLLNRSVSKLPSDSQMSEQCLFLQRNRSRGKPGCSFHSREKEECVSNEILVGSLSWLHSQLNNLAIEDLLKKSRDLSGCPYYASRRAIPYLEIVLLPYNLLLNEKSREALGMDLKVCLEAAFHRRTRWCCSSPTPFPMMRR